MNTGYARKYELQVDRKVNGAVQSTVTYSMVTPAAPGTQIPGNGYVAVTLADLMALSTANYKTKVQAFLDAIANIAVATKDQLKNLSEFADNLNCSVGTTAPVGGTAAFVSASAAYGTSVCTGHEEGYHTFDVTFQITASVKGNYRVVLGSGVDLAETTVSVTTDGGTGNGTLSGVQHPGYLPFSTFLVLPDYNVTSAEFVVNATNLPNPVLTCRNYAG